MYIVEWNDHEGNQHQIEFEKPEDAELEAESLREKYDGVDVKCTAPEVTRAEREEI